MARKSFKNPETIVNTAKENGWVSGKHTEKDRQTGVNKYVKEVRGGQDAVMHVFAVWRWKKSGCVGDFDSCKSKVLCEGAAVPPHEELKDFWRFYKSQAKGIIDVHPTVKSLKSKAKQFNAGFLRCTKASIGEDTIAEINHWLKYVLPTEEDSHVEDKEWPKYNAQKTDVDEVLIGLWIKPDLIFTHERYRIQVHFQLLVYCSSGARIGALFKNGGLRYKDVQLVLRRSPGKAGHEVIWRLDQRWVKNNRNEHKAYGITGKEHGILRYNSGAFLLCLGLADKALFDFDSLDDLGRQKIPDGRNEVPLRWNDWALDIPICRAADRQRIILPDQAMGEQAFRRILGCELREYVGVLASVHQIRRQLGKQIDGRYTETERSQHILQADPRVFGQSYVANVSSCDGAAAWLDEEPDHSVVDYFQGIGQFRERGCPTRLPTAQRVALSRDPEIVDIDRQLMHAADVDERPQLQKRRQNAMRRLERKALKSYQSEWMKERRDQIILTRGNMPAEASEDPDPLHYVIPAKRRVAEKMRRDSPLDAKEMRDAIEDMISLVTMDHSVFYRPGEEPKNGQCPECEIDMDTMKKERRCKHIHDCRRKAEAKKLAVTRSSLQFCDFCLSWFVEGHDWEQHCQQHVSSPLKRCGSILYCSTLIRPAFCPLCWQSEWLLPSKRMASWDRDADAIKHMDEDHKLPWYCRQCNTSHASKISGYHHLKDAHGYNIGQRGDGEASCKEEAMRMGGAGSAKPISIVDGPDFMPRETSFEWDGEESCATTLTNGLDEYRSSSPTDDLMDKFIILSPELPATEGFMLEDKTDSDITSIDLTNSDDYSVKTKSSGSSPTTPFPRFFRTSGQDRDFACQESTIASEAAEATSLGDELGQEPNCHAFPQCGGLEQGGKRRTVPLELQPSARPGTAGLFGDGNCFAAPIVSRFHCNATRGIDASPSRLPAVPEQNTSPLPSPRPSSEASPSVPSQAMHRVQMGDDYRNSALPTKKRTRIKLICRPPKKAHSEQSGNSQLAEDDRGPAPRTTNRPRIKLIGQPKRPISCEDEKGETRDCGDSRRARKRIKIVLKRRGSREY